MWCVMEEMIFINKFKGIVEVKMRIINFSLKFIMSAKPSIIWVVYHVVETNGIVGIDTRI
jgi:hypothetical protein